MQYTSSLDIASAIKTFEDRGLHENIKASLVKDVIIRNLYLHLVSCKNFVSKTFIFRYTFNSRIYSITLGKLETLPLDSAREIATKYNTLLDSIEFQASGLDLKSFLINQSKNSRDMTLCIKDLAMESIIGILPEERNVAQKIILNANIKYVYNQNEDNFLDYMKITNFIKECITNNKYGLLESALIDISNRLFSNFSSISSMFLEIGKPNITQECNISVYADFKR